MAYTRTEKECYACGDVARHRFQGKSVCKECLDELKDGVVVNQNIHFFGGTPATMNDDAGPWQENAVRCMEDGIEAG